jgi:hypothetical protein
MIGKNDRIELVFIIILSLYFLNSFYNKTSHTVMYTSKDLPCYTINIPDWVRVWQFLITAKAGLDMNNKSIVGEEIVGLT